MKKLYLIFCFALIPLMGLSQNVITVDNRANSGADYTSVVDAHTNAIAGDTIQVHPSATNYGNLTITKQIVLVGMGHNPANSADNVRAYVVGITISSFAFNTVITGLRINAISASTNTDISGVKILNNYINSNVTGTSNGNADNWIIEGNYFDAGGVNPSGSDGWIVKNNLFDNTTYAMTNFDNTSSFLNNLVLLTSINFANTCVDPVVNNNIIILRDPGELTVGLTSSTIAFNNCLTFNPNGGSIGALPGNNNLDNTNPQFVSAPFPSIDDLYNNDYSLGGGSPGVNYGTDGTDIGLFGANFVFDNNGRPDLWPYMTSLNITNSSVPMGQNINVEFTASKKN
ncbi:MAG: hypothetical protein HKN00_03625 [Flavobacteriaceae bacterium]|nr:hypothetical protein [Flavobacteriaceae bacterium]